MPSRLRSLRADKAGSAGVFVGLTAAALIGASALAVDIMSFYRTKRTLQTATDLAAVAAAADPANATAAASATLAANGINATITSLTQGSYTPNSATPVGARFAANAAPTDAVSLATAMTTRVSLGSIFSLLNHSSPSSQTGVAIAARAIAMRKAVAAFGVGSRLAALNGGVLNSILTATTGSSVNLTLADYQSLAATQIDLLGFSRTLATNAQLTASDYNSILAANVSSGTMIGTLASLASGGLTPSAVAVLRQVSGTMPYGSTLQLGSLFAFGPYANNGSDVIPSLTVSTDALDLFDSIVGLATNGHQIDATIATGVPGLTAKVSLVVGSPAVAVVAGVPGTSASTAQVRMQVSFGIAVPGLATAQLPIAVTAARATAQLTGISCPVNTNSAAVATLGVTPSVATVGIGTLTNLADFSAGSTMQPAQILSVAGLASVTGSAQGTLGGTQTSPVSYTMSDVANGTVKTTTSGQIVGSLATSLIGRLQLNVTVLGLPIGIGPTITQPLTTALNAAAPSMDAILSSLLQTLGLGIGQADTWVTDIKCGSAVLMN